MMQSQHQTTSRQGHVSGEFLTSTYRISGEVVLKGDPLLDQLNDHLALFITLEKMFVSPLMDPTTLTGNFEHGEVRKDNIGIVVLAQAQDGLPQRKGRYAGRDHVDRKLLIAAGGFEVRGMIRQHPTVNVPHMLRTTPEQFIPIFNATATLTANRDITFNGGAILVNRAQVEVFSMMPK